MQGEELTSRSFTARSSGIYNDESKLLKTEAGTQLFSPGHAKELPNPGVVRVLDQSNPKCFKKSAPTIGLFDIGNSV
ncbi:hypothetical protein TNIN_400581 [Trichonephila inaurata madagascariensis]|uniref:Uncharacterized protein n=1 Tax=Trichonephila inaurata madagascariensis TaxID=2747483 RepID=A0A8X6WZQ9_9ARAC|nr:hypothetical protein TNIN_400581 [Trichonephila inaurata madagascariensis]